MEDIIQYTEKKSLRSLLMLKNVREILRTRSFRIAVLKSHIYGQNY